MRSLIVDDDKTLAIDFDLRVFQAQPGAVRPPADRNQHAAESLGPVAGGAFQATSISLPLSVSEATFVSR